MIILCPICTILHCDLHLPSLHSSFHEPVVGIAHTHYVPTYVFRFIIFPHKLSILCPKRKSEAYRNKKHFETYEVMNYMQTGN